MGKSCDEEVSIESRRVELLLQRQLGRGYRVLLPRQLTFYLLLGLGTSTCKFAALAAPSRSKRKRFASKMEENMAAQKPTQADVIWHPVDL
jgi:hypothetical protein